MNTQDEKLIATMGDIMADLALRPQGPTITAMIEALTSLYPTVEFRADRENDSIAWRDRIDATIIPFHKTQGVKHEHFPYASPQPQLSTKL